MLSVAENGQKLPLGYTRVEWQSMTQIRHSLEHGKWPNIHLQTRPN